MIDTNAINIALLELKRSLKLLSALDAELAAAAISMKLVDVVDCLNTGNNNQAAVDLWACSSTIQRVVYEALVAKLGKQSSYAGVAAKCMTLGDFREACAAFRAASAEISEGTGYEILFIRSDK